MMCAFSVLQPKFLSLAREKGVLKNVDIDGFIRDNPNRKAGIVILLHLYNLMGSFNAHACTRLNVFVSSPPFDPCLPVGQQVGSNSLLL